MWLRRKVRWPYMCSSHIARRRAAVHFKKTKCVWVFTFGVNGTVRWRRATRQQYNSNEREMLNIYKDIRYELSCDWGGNINHSCNMFLQFAHVSVVEMPQQCIMPWLHMACVWRVCGVICTMQLDTSTSWQLSNYCLSKDIIQWHMQWGYEYMLIGMTYCK